MVFFDFVYPMVIGRSLRWLVGGIFWADDGFVRKARARAQRLMWAWPVDGGIEIDAHGIERATLVLVGTDLSIE